MRREVVGQVGRGHVAAERAGALGGYMAATDLADHLAAHGVPFREAHEVVGKLVLLCEQKGCSLQDLTLDDLRTASPAFASDALEAVDIERIVARRVSEGGTGHEAVRVQILRARAAVAADQEWLATRDAG